MAFVRPRLILLCGLPGAGKTTLAKKLEQELSAVRLCPDEWIVDLAFDRLDGEARDRVEQRLWFLAQDLLSKGAVVIMENGFWERVERDEKRLLARSLEAAVELRYLAVSSQELHERISLRNKEPGALLITHELLAECEAAFEVPQSAELSLFDTPLP